MCTKYNYVFNKYSHWIIHRMKIAWLHLLYTQLEQITRCGEIIFWWNKKWIHTKNIPTYLLQSNTLCCVDWHSRNQTRIFFMTLHLLQYIITFFDKPLTQIRPAFCSGRGDFFFIFNFVGYLCAYPSSGASRRPFQN